MRPTIPLLALVATALATATAAAQPAPDPKQQADQLFKDGREFVRTGRYAEACPMFKESERLDPSLAARCNIAVVCHQMTGHTGTAYNLLEEVARDARADPGKTQSLKCATDAMDALKPDLALLSVDARALEGVPGVTLTRDGVPLPAAQWGKPLAVDPGAHVVEVTAPGRRPWRGTATATARSTYALAVPALEVDTRAAEDHARNTAPQDTPRWTALHTSAVAATAVGGAGIVVGAIAGLISLIDSKTAGCSGGICPTQSALDTSHAAYQAGNVSTAGFVVGGVVLAGGIALWIVAPSRTPRPVHDGGGPQTPATGVAVSVDLRPGGLSLRGAW